MKRAFIFANGQMNGAPPAIKEIGEQDLVIAADGGSHHCQALGITPDVIIGDLDSLDSLVVRRYEQIGVKVLRYLPVKDETDLELALLYSQEQAIHDIIILGAFGARWDMTIANTLLAAQPRFTNLTVRLVDGNQELNILREGDQVILAGKKGAVLSLVPLAGDVHGIDTSGVEYPLQGQTLYFGSPRGVSNVIIDDHAQISLKQGMLLLCVSSPAVD